VCAAFPLVPIKKHIDIKDNFDLVSAVVIVVQRLVFKVSKKVNQKN
jgi:hypothetical protein